MKLNAAGSAFFSLVSSERNPVHALLRPFCDANQNIVKWWGKLLQKHVPDLN